MYVLMFKIFKLYLIIYQTEETDLMSWTERHPHNWTSAEVMDWVYYVAQEFEMDSTNYRGDNFNDLTGEQLCEMKREDFLCRDPVNGDMLFNLCQKVLEKGKYIVL